MNDSDGDNPVQESDAEGARPEPEVVPAISSEQPAIAAAIGLGAYANRENDEESHVAPTDNDGETVPRDKAVDKVGG